MNKAQNKMSTVIHINERERSYAFHASVRKIVLLGISLPMFGMFFGILWSIFFDMERTTATHCLVKNYLPSISAAFNYFPTSSVWRICISLHLFTKIVLFYLTTMNRSKKMNQLSLLAPYQGSLSKFATTMNGIENFSLLCLTMITSKENKTIHVISFTFFVISSISYIVSIYLLYSSMVLETQLERKSLRLKKRYCTINILSFLLVVYSYYRHNAYCEPGVYTMFAFFEYIFVLSNIGFHYTESLDFHSYSCIVGEDRKISSS
uniref:post-GPI attachment to proteins factor 2-like isoform X2 n=1 Tax=Styela clava TaxID=7725 RepID=UPI00193ABD01|nr:post-GPI attachment to proteins factor 2-like isoform X2 [Styela clava]XP_039269111.1 post-GPI attachment to proteins factor 2-like isoform X2 [Styela clava]